MKKKSLILSALAMSLGLALSAAPVANAALPVAVQGSRCRAWRRCWKSLARRRERACRRHPGAASTAAGRVQTLLRPQFPGQQQSSRPFEGLGSGVIIDAAKGYVLTNNHVINNADKIRVQLNDGRELDAKLVGRDEQSDIALLQLSDTKT